MKKSNVYSLVGNGALAMIKEAYKINSTFDKDINWCYRQIYRNLQKTLVMQSKLYHILKKP